MISHVLHSTLCRRAKRRAEIAEKEEYERLFGEHADKVRTMTRNLERKKQDGLYPSRRVFRAPERPSKFDSEALRKLDDFEPPRPMSRVGSRKDTRSALNEASE